MVKNSRLNSPFVLIMIAYAQAADWGTPPLPMREMISAAFSGWIQSRINEKGNKVCRDCETRGNMSKARFISDVVLNQFNQQS